MCRHEAGGRSYGADFPPLAAFFGGVVAQEVVKCTGKYTPLRQYLYLDALDTLSACGPSARAALSIPRDVNVYGARAADAVALFGPEVVARLRAQVRRRVMRACGACVIDKRVRSAFSSLAPGRSAASCSRTLR